MINPIRSTLSSSLSRRLSTSIAIAHVTALTILLLGSWGDVSARTNANDMHNKHAPLSPLQIGISEEVRHHRAWRNELIQQYITQHDDESNRSQSNDLRWSVLTSDNLRSIGARQRTGSRSSSAIDISSVSGHRRIKGMSGKGMSGKGMSSKRGKGKSKKVRGKEEEKDMKSSMMSRKGMDSSKNSRKMNLEKVSRKPLPSFSTKSPVLPVMSIAPATAPSSVIEPDVTTSPSSTSKGSDKPTGFVPSSSDAPTPNKVFSDEPTTAVMQTSIPTTPPTAVVLTPVPTGPRDNITDPTSGPSTQSNVQSDEPTLSPVFMPTDSSDAPTVSPVLEPTDASDSPTISPVLVPTGASDSPTVSPVFQSTDSPISSSGSDRPTNSLPPCISTEEDLTAAIQAVPDVVDSPVKLLLCPGTITLTSEIDLTGKTFELECFNATASKKSSSNDKPCRINGRRQTRLFRGGPTFAGFNGIHFTEGESPAGSIFYVIGGTVALTDCILSNSSAADGGAIFVDSEAILLLDRSFLFQNSAENGGAIYSIAGDVRMSGTRFMSNFASEVRFLKQLSSLWDFNHPELT